MAMPPVFRTALEFLGLGDPGPGLPISPNEAGAPEEVEALPTLDRMVSQSPDTLFAPAGWTKHIQANPDQVANKDGRGLALYDDLLDDDVCFSSLQQRRLAITSRDLEVAPGDAEDPRSVMAADDFRAMIKAFSFDNTTGKLHFAVWHGYAVGEAMFTTKLHDGRTIIWLKDIVVPDRSWFGFDAYGTLRMATLWDGFASQDLPPNKFVSVRTGASHDFAFYGLGLAHWCYYPVFFKRAGVRFWAREMERKGRPTVLGLVSDQATDAEKAKAMNIAGAIGRDSHAVATKEFIDTVKLMEAKNPSSGGSGQQEFLKEQNDALMRIILGQPGTSTATPTGLGSGQSEAHADVKAEIVKADSDLISQAIAPIARWLTTWNHGEDVAPPTVYRVLDDAEDINVIADRDVKLNGIGIKRTEESVREVYGEGYEVDRMSEADKAAQEDRRLAMKVNASAAKPGTPANDDDLPDDEKGVAFEARELDAIDRLAAAMVDDSSPLFSAIGTEMRDRLEGVTTAEGARVAILEAMERFPREKLGAMLGLPLLAERAAAVVGAEEEVSG